MLRIIRFPFNLQGNPDNNSTCCRSNPACSIYDYDNVIFYDSSLHAPETDTEDEEADCARYYDGSEAHIQSCMYCLHESQSVSTNAVQVISHDRKIFPESVYDSDSNSSNPEGQGYDEILTESDVHPCLTCNSAEEMIAQAQPQYVTLQEITDWEIESTDYDNIESTEEVGPDPVTGNALTTLTMYDLTKDFAELFPEEKPTELPPLTYPMEIMQHIIDVILDSYWSSRFPSTYKQFKNQIILKIKTDLQTGRVVPSKSSNAIGMFAQPKRDKPHEARFLLDCISSNLLTHKDATPIPSEEQIIDCVVSVPFRRKLDLSDRYHNIRIHTKSGKDSTFYCHMAKYDCLVI